MPKTTAAAEISGVLSNGLRCGCTAGYTVKDFGLALACRSQVVSIDIVCVRSRLSVNASVFDREDSNFLVMDEVVSTVVVQGGQTAKIHRTVSSVKDLK